MWCDEGITGINEFMNGGCNVKCNSKLSFGKFDCLNKRFCFEDPNLAYGLRSNLAKSTNQLSKYT